MIAKSHPHIPSKGPCANFFRVQIVLTLQGLPGFFSSKIELEPGGEGFFGETFPSRITRDNYLALGAPNGGALFIGLD